jgi:hypothetical protein
MLSKSTAQTGETKAQFTFRSQGTKLHVSKLYNRPGFVHHLFKEVHKKEMFLSAICKWKRQRTNACSIPTENQKTPTNLTAK